MFKFISEHKRGVIGTTLFHLLILIFFIIYKGFSTPLPLPDEEGILVNFGTEETGFGDIEPQTTKIKPIEQETIEPPEQTETVEELVEENIEEVTESNVEEMITQDIEEAPEVKEAEKLKKEEEEKQRKEREKIAELKKITEKRRNDSIAEAKIEQQRIEDQIKKDMANRFTGNQSNSQGDTQGTGNQGKTDGDPYAKNYDGSGKGEGYKWKLKGRNVQNLVEPEYKQQVAGTIVVEVIVNRAGNVTEARPGIKGSSTTDNRLMDAAKKAALKTKFDTKPDAPPRQTGSITYHFILE